MPQQNEVDRSLIFVSYASEDVNIATRICDGLRAQGLDLFFAPWEHFSPGLVRRLNEGLGEAEHFVIFLSSHSVSKPWPIAEQEVATLRNIAEGTPVVLVNLGLEEKRVPPLLRRLGWINAREDAVEEAISRILGQMGYQDQVVAPACIPAPLIETGIPRISSEPRLTDIERIVVGILFRLAVGEKERNAAFRIGFERLADAAKERGIDAEELKEALEVLKRVPVPLVEFDRYLGGGFAPIHLTTVAVEACCEELVENYADRKNTVLAVVLETPTSRSTSSDEIIERTGEETWLVLHVLKEAESRGDLKLQPIYKGRPFFTVYSISPLLARNAPPGVDYARLSYLLQRRLEKAGPAGIKVDDQELSLIRLIEDRGPLKLKSYRETGSPPWSVNAWCLVSEERCVRGVQYAPGNKWFHDTLTLRLPNRALAEISSKGATLTENGRVVYRKEAGREIAEPPLEWMPMEKK